MSLLSSMFSSILVIACIISVVRWLSSTVYLDATNKLFEFMEFLYSNISKENCDHFGGMETYIFMSEKAIFNVKNIYHMLSR